MTWEPDWEVPEVPCEDPETCHPKNPTCSACINGMNAYLNEYPANETNGPHWEELQEWQRGVWRLEADDAWS